MKVPYFTSNRTCTYQKRKTMHKICEIHFNSNATPLPTTIGRRLQRDEDNRCLILNRRLPVLNKELEASLDRKHSLEKENVQLKRELAHLRTQLSSLRVQDVVNKSADAAKQKPTIQLEIPDETPTVKVANPICLESTVRKGRPTRVPKSPPNPTSTIRSLLPEENTRNIQPMQAPPPRPPPLPSKLLVGTKVVRRIPEVMEFYRLLTRWEARIGSKTNISRITVALNTANMIGEIENRSSYLLAIKSDVEKQGEFIKFLAREVENAVYTEISDVEAFIKWLDDELSYLVDERAVLKHFPDWPEQKADAMREAAFSYRDLKNLESEVSSFQDNAKQPLPQALKRIHTLQDRLERGVQNVERMRETASKRYRDLQIPWEWMLDTGVVDQLKQGSLRLAKVYMKRIVNELQTNDCSKGENLMLQGVRFAFRVHQFASGFDTYI